MPPVVWRPQSTRSTRLSDSIRLGCPSCGVVYGEIALVRNCITSSDRLEPVGERLLVIGRPEAETMLSCSALIAPFAEPTGGSPDGTGPLVDAEAIGVAAGWLD